MGSKGFKGLISILCLSAVGSVAFSASASYIANTKIKELQIVGSQAIVYLDNDVTGRAGCHYPLAANQYALDYSTAKGKIMLQIVQAALLANKKVHVGGGPSCTTVQSSPIENMTSISIVAQ